MHILAEAEEHTGDGSMRRRARREVAVAEEEGVGRRASRTWQGESGSTRGSRGGGGRRWRWW